MDHSKSRRVIRRLARLFSGEPPEAPAFDALNHQLKAMHLDDQTPQFSLAGTNTLARVLDVYDGDTMTLGMVVFGKPFRFQCRIIGIDTSEMKSADPHLRRNALRARNRVLQLLGQPDVSLDDVLSRSIIRARLDARPAIVQCTCSGFDKYGRVLVSVAASGIDVSATLLSEGLAHAYDGKGPKGVP